MHSNRPPITTREIVRFLIHRESEFYTPFPDEMLDATVTVGFHPDPDSTNVKLSTNIEAIDKLQAVRSEIRSKKFNAESKITGVYRVVEIYSSDNNLIEVNAHAGLAFDEMKVADTTLFNSLLFALEEGAGLAIYSSEDSFLLSADDVEQYRFDLEARRLTEGSLADEQDGVAFTVDELEEIWNVVGNHFNWVKDLSYERKEFNGKITNVLSFTSYELMEQDEYKVKLKELSDAVDEIVGNNPYIVDASTSVTKYPCNPGPEFAWLN